MRLATGRPASTRRSSLASCADPASQPIRRRAVTGRVLACRRLDVAARHDRPAPRIGPVGAQARFGPRRYRWRGEALNRSPGPSPPAAATTSAWDEILRYARRYASPHNSQPIKLRVAGARAALFYDLDLGLPAESYGIPFGSVCAGVFIETVSIAAHALGYRVAEALDYTPMDFGRGDRLHPPGRSRSSRPGRSMTSTPGCCSSVGPPGCP